MENIWLFFRVCLMQILISVGKASVFQKGFDHHYVYKANSDLLGVQNVTTIIKFHIQHQNVSQTGDKLNTLWLDSFVQFTQSGQYADNPKKWNLSRPFLFTVSPKGIVLHAFVHSEEDDEVLTLKKVISSTFSANITIQNDTQWTYSSTDSDHIGILPHEYTGTRTDSGIRLSRYHRSIEHVERIHAKTLHIDKYGTIVSMEGEDNIILKNRRDTKSIKKRIPYPGEYVINSTEEGGIGTIKATAEIHVKLLSKRRIRQKSERVMYHGLQLDNVLYLKGVCKFQTMQSVSHCRLQYIGLLEVSVLGIRMKKKQKKTFASLEANIKAAIECSHQYSDKSNTNRTICVNNLRQNITSLNENDYESLVSEFLSKECEPNDTKCEDERLLFTDIVAREGSELSQRLVLKHVFQNITLDEEAIRRALIHFTTLVTPTAETVTAVKKLCFGENNEHHGAVNMTVMVQRSCLALGAIAKALRKSGNDTAASAILEHLHAWLYDQGDETPEHLRPRRSALNVDSAVSDDHLLSKFVLLHSLGNAAHPSSLKHLHKYATPNARVPAWRRAALAAMEYDKGNETARVLLDSLTLDKTETVRSVAMEQFLAHPLQKHFTKRLGDTLLSQNYTYQTVVRLKRALDLSAALLEFKIELPAINWGEEVGNEDIGASFGVEMVNKMHLHIHPLNTFFHMHVRDRIYAEAHVGILDLKVDIIRIEVCYKAELNFNLNMLKDFSYGEAQQDFDEFSRDASSLLLPLFDAVDGIASHFKASSGKESTFQSSIDTVTKMPVQALRLIDSSNNLLSVLNTYQGLPLLSKARRLAFLLQGLAEDIRADTLNIYSEIAETVLIVLPHAEAQMTESSNMISDIQGNVGSRPQQAFETIDMAKQRIKYAAYQFLKVKSVIQNELSPHGGSMPTWLSSKDEIKMAISDTKSLLLEIKAAQEKSATFANKDANDFVKLQRLSDMEHALSNAVNDLKKLNANINTAHSVFMDTLMKIQKIKLSVDEMDKKKKETQSFIKKIFGPKFNPAFPAKRRGLDFTCGRGTWPTTARGRYRDYPGVDVIVEENENVVNPVNGKVFSTTKDGEVRIIPLDDDFKMFTIFIRNIRVGDSISTDGSVMKAGQIIGHGKGTNGCAESHIHVAMSRKTEDGSSKCSFVDPTAYLVNIKPVPLWHVECKEFIFKHIGNTIQAGLSGLGAKEILDNFIKRAMTWAGTKIVQTILPIIMKSTGSSVPEQMTDSYLSQYNCEISDTFMKPGSNSEIGNKKCQERSDQQFSTGKQKLSTMKKNLAGTSLKEIEDTIRRIKSAAGGIQLDDISSMAFSRYGKILDKLNVPFKGSKQSMETVIQMLTWKVCPTFENGVAQGYGHQCIPFNGCSGLNCTIHIPNGIKKEHVPLAVQFNSKDSTFTLITSNGNTTIAVDGTHKQYSFANMLRSYVVTILSYTNTFNVSIGKVFQLTLSAELCNKYAYCLPEVHIFEKLTFLVQRQLRPTRSATADCFLGANVNINNVGHFGGNVHMDKTGRITGGSVDVGIQDDGIDVGGRFHINSHGEWDVNIKADFDLNDENKLETGLSLRGTNDKVSFGLSVEAELGEGESVGGFIGGNTDGDTSFGFNGNFGNNNNTQISAGLNASSDGTVDAAIKGSTKIGNSTVKGSSFIHHTKDGTSGGGGLDININKNTQISAGLNASSDGTVDGAIKGSTKIGNSTVKGSGFIHHTKDGTSGGGGLDVNINKNTQISAGLNASSDGTVDGAIKGSTKIGNSTIKGSGFIHHTKDGTSGGGGLDVSINKNTQISAGLNASSDGTVDGAIKGSTKIGNSTVKGSGFIHHTKDGTSGGGGLDVNINKNTQISAGLNASSDGTVDGAIKGSTKIGNSTIKGSSFIHHTKDGTSGGGGLDVNINKNTQISAGLNASSDGTVAAGMKGSTKTGNSTVKGSGFIHHTKDGTSGGGGLDVNINKNTQISAGLNASSDGTVDAAIKGSTKIGNSTVKGSGFIHHTKDGTSGGGGLDVNINKNTQISAGLNASSDGTVDAAIKGSTKIGNSTIKGSGFIHHTKDGTSGGGGLDVNINKNTQISAGLNASSDGTVAAGMKGSTKIGNSTVKGSGFIHHTKDGTSGGGGLDVNINKNTQISAGLHASSDGTVDAAIKGSTKIGNSTVKGSGFIHHTKDGTSGGGGLDVNINKNTQISAGLNASSDGTVDAAIKGSTEIGNSTVNGSGFIHHTKDGTSGGGTVTGNINNNNQISASFNRSSEGKISAGASGSVPIGNSSISGSGYIHKNKNGTRDKRNIKGVINNIGQMSVSFNALSDGQNNDIVKRSTQTENTSTSEDGYLYDTKDKIGEERTEAAHHVNVRSADNCLIDIFADVGKDGSGIGGNLNIPGFGKIGANLDIKDGQLSGKLSIGEFSVDFEDFEKLSMDDINQVASDLNINSDTTGVMNQVRDGMKQKVRSFEAKLTVGFKTEEYEEDFPARDMKDGAVYKDKHIEITFLEIEIPILPVGPKGITFGFGAGGAIGNSMWSHIQALRGDATFSIGPWVSGMVWGKLSIDLYVFSCGIKLTGYILKTKFPITMEIKSNKHPLTVVNNIDLELTPIELHLRAWVKLLTWKVYDGCIWKWACTPIKWNILRREEIHEDKSQPKFVSSAFCGGKRRKREVNKCSVTQIPNRHPSDTAYELEVSATDEDSGVNTWFAIGTSPAGKDVKNWTKFKGNNQVVPSKMPNGVPLYFTIKAQNVQGLSSYIQCKLETYDNTLPDGRVEASHKFSSNPRTVGATVIVVDDSTIDSTFKALGLSPGQYGSEIVDWESFSLSKTTIRSGVSSNLKYFSSPRNGKLIVTPIDSSISEYSETCAENCLKMAQCVSFSYEQQSETCELYDVIESHANNLHVKGDFYNYERLGGGYSSYVEYQNQAFEHGTVYYVNVFVKNSLGYQSTLFSEGTLIDFTPPVPGYPGNVSQDVTVSHRCKSSVRQRCEQVTEKPNHRIVVDGPDGRTVFNGNKPLYDTKYTITNHYVTANWDGFSDPESGIWGYVWAVGTKPCGDDIVNFEDPYKHIPSPNHWTSTGFHDNLALKDGKYYVTVEALNNVVFGGALVTTVCHSVPFLVDTTPPDFHNITDVMFDEDFDILAAYYNVSDRESGISRVDFGLGMTKHDVELRAYSRHDFMERNDPYLVIEHLELKPGIPAWVRLRAVNNVDLFAAGHAREPIIVDKTPPISGIVLDGYSLREDMEYQHETEEICAQWQDFFDPESGINRFMWGVGTHPQRDDIVLFKNMSKFVRHSCNPANLRHNVTYFSTIVAINDALNTKRSNSSSNGVLVDITPPFPGKVDDRSVISDFTDDIDYSSETAAVLASWKDFYDPESDIDHYDINIEINNETAKVLPLSTETFLEDHSFSLHHLDIIQVEVYASNGAKLQTSVRSDGVLVDHTPPNLHYVYDTTNGNRFQSDNTKLCLRWEFSDPESGIAEYRYMIKEIDSGITKTLYPENGDFISINPQPQVVSMDIESLPLKSGALYKVHVIAVNKARLSSSHLSAGVLIDTTAPIVKTVKLSLPNEEEDLDDTDTYVLHAGLGPLTISWIARDSESGIKQVKVGVGNMSGDVSLTNGFIVLSNGETHTVISDLNLRFYEEDSPVLYYASVIAVNQAGLESNLISSKPIKVLQENVPGTVFDGRQDLQDSDYTKDKTSLGMSFADFESKACNIVSYEWAVGSKPYLTDILPFTDYGIVMTNESKGHAHINIELHESQVYFAAVRARTGQMCKEEYILSVSDGITFDSKKPVINLKINSNNKIISQETDYQSKSIYQQTTDNLDISWSITDESGIAEETWSIGSLPDGDDIHNLTKTNANGIPSNLVSLHVGTANFVTIRAKDKAGNQAVMTSPPLIVDTSVPEIDGFSCTKVFSVVNIILSCKWLFISDRESTIISISYGISSRPLALDILNFTEIPVERRSWYRNFAHNIVNADIEKVYMSLRVKNSAGHVFITEETAIIDRTPPFNGTVTIVTKDSLTPTDIATICQLSQQYVEIEVKGFMDEESSLSRLEIGLGSDIGKTDIQPFAKFEIREYILIGGLQLVPGMTVFATVKVYNDVNLYSTTWSQGVVISPSPILSVLDGDRQKDKEYLSDLNIIQGRWEYSDHCPITKAEWAVKDLSGNMVQEFIPILNANMHFINDELRTENGHTYINIIRTTDALNRTRIAYSNGITVRIQPPKISNVRDGLESEDINYQRSVSELTGNWDEFGDYSSEHPSQLILKYEVAVGDDIRFPKTRTNIHSFVNVGLNRTIAFKNLKLAAKKSRYFLTVRAFSAAGSFVEGYSNGIQVGYEDTITPGDLIYKAFQSSYQNIEISWSDYISDYGIRHYEIAVSTVTQNTTNDTVDCSVLKSGLESFDIQQLTSVGLNTVANITGLSLSHGKSYFVTLVAEDESKSCIAVTSGPILIDTSEPVLGNVFLNNREIGAKYNFINSSTLKVSWDNFSDRESGICCFRVLLAEQDGCGPSLSSHILKEQSVNVTEVTFYQLQEEKKYIIKVTVTNNANLSSSITTTSIYLDKKPPLIGHVKVGVDWKRPVSVQHSSTTLNGTILIARTQDAYTCPLQKEFSPSSKNLFSTWHPLTGDFSPECISVTNNGLIIEVKTDEHIFTEIVKGGVQTNDIEIKDGVYTFRMTGLRGENMVTSVSILREHSVIPFNFSETLDDINDSSEQYKNGTSSNESPDGIQRMYAHDHYGTGFLIPGYRILNETNMWNILFWAADSYETKLAWVTVDFDPSDKEAKYDISLMKENRTNTMKWNVIFTVNDEEKASIDAMTFQNKIRIYVEGYNKNGYVPGVEDIFSPFHSKITLSSVHVPSQKDTPCRYGKPFVDGEGGIHEIWAAVSNSQNESENLLKYALQKTYCLPCKSRCNMECDADCPIQTNEPLEIVHLTLSNLTMLPSSNISLDLVNNISSGSDFNKFSTESYYINIKVVDFAGNFKEAISEAVIIDDTPPKFNQMSCVNPRHSLDEPSLYQGTNSSVAAYWECDDDISQITEYTACVGSSAGHCDIKPMENIGLQTSVLLEGLGGLLLDGNTYFVTVTAYNAAGLKTSGSCNITVQLQLPETSHFKSDEMFSIPVENALPTVAFSDRTDRLGVHWESNDNDTEFYEWEIGSTDTASDIFPRVKIGTKYSTKAAVIDGHLWLDDVNTSTTVKEYVLRNWTEEELAEAKSHGNVFNFEPGRCIHVNLYSVNQAHLSSKIPVKPVCMKRKDDVFINFEQEAVQEVIAANDTLKIHHADVLDGDMALKLTFNGTEGGMLIGLLREEDLEEIYGSSASDSYRSYIASPLTKTKTSRLMRNRFHGYTGLSFYISPTGYTKLNDWIDVSMHLNNTEESSVPALIYWDQVYEEWKKITEDCETEENIDGVTNTYSAKICLPSHNSQRQRRSIDISSEVDGPRQFSLVFISKNITESQPVIKTDLLSYSEDEANVELKLIDYYDADDDDVSFRLIGYPKHGFANITSDGKLYYKPDTDFSGNDEVIVECTETSLPSWERQPPVHASVHIFVSEVNDAPDLLFLRDNDTFTGDRVNKVILPMESNSTGYIIGTFLARDIDRNDNLTELVFDTSSSEANFTLYELQDPYILDRLNSSNRTADETVRLFQLELSMSRDFFGVIEYGLIVHDNAGHWSLPVKLSIGILYNPCVFGYCVPREKLPCSDFLRAQSFDSFRCECEAGYEGVWCETETNECNPEPCTMMFDCEDLVAGFQCNINILKLLAVLVCSLLAMTIGLVCIICCRRRCSGKMDLSVMEKKKTAKDKCSPFDPSNATFKKIEPGACP